MTNAKAIETLEYIRHTGNGESFYNHDAQSIALDMAIAALKAEPCEDAVSREEALDAVHNAYINAYDIKSLIKDSMQFIKDLPPVTPKPKTGHWITLFIDEDGLLNGYCDCCNHIGYVSDNFCSNCGTEMEGVSE